MPVLVANARPKKKTSAGKSNLPDLLAPGLSVDVPMRRRARLSGLGEPYNISATLDADRMQSILRAAERGDTYLYFSMVRDMILGYSHLNSEWFKRKAVVVGQPHSLIPAAKDNPEDQRAADVISEMIDYCENWMDALDHLLDATLYPVSVGEKIFEPVPSYEARANPVRFALKKIAPVSYTLLCFKLPFYPQLPAQTRPGTQSNPALVWNPDSWESGLRFYDTNENGYPRYAMDNIYEPDRELHIVHRGNMLNRAVPDNFGGQIRAVLGWWFLGALGKEWFGRFMERYGSPFLAGKTDTANKELVTFLNQAFSLATKVGGIVIDKRDEIDVIQAAATEGANAHKTLLNHCNDEVSKVVIGQILSSSPKNTGLGSGVAELHGEVRQDYRQYDTRKLSDTLRKQLFVPYLRMNGYLGRAPMILWGGEKEHEALMLGQTINQFYAGGVEPTDDGLATISRRVGIEMQRRPEPAAAPVQATT